jgi:ATP-binding protein involved in chromosome partitioning
LDLKEKVYKALENVNDPEIHKSLIELSMIGDVFIEGRKAVINVVLTTAGCPLKAKIGKDIRDEVGKIEGISEVDVVFGEMTGEQKEELRKKLQTLLNAQKKRHV